MKVAILFSGGKDSWQAVQWALDNNHDIKALVTMKPESPEAWIWHYPLTGFTPLQAKSSRLPHILVACPVVGTKEEALVLESILPRLDIDAILLGGVGLQKTQIRESRNIAGQYGIKTIVPFEGLKSEELLRKEIEGGIEMIISEVAADGLGRGWLGQRLTATNVDGFISISKRFGFDVLGEGGYYNTFVTWAPCWSQKVELECLKKVWDDKTSSGWLEAGGGRLVDVGPKPIAT